MKNGPVIQKICASSKLGCSKKLNAINVGDIYRFYGVKKVKICGNVITGDIQRCVSPSGVQVESSE